MISSDKPGSGIPEYLFFAGAPRIHACRTVPEKKNVKSDVALTAFWRILCICRCLYVRTDMGHREALVLFAGAGGTFPEVLFALVECEFLATVDAYIFSGSDFLSCVVRLIFGQTIHQTSHLRQRYIWVVFVPVALPHLSTDFQKCRILCKGIC